MAFVIVDNCQQTITGNSGTGSKTLDSAVSGHLAFTSQMSNGDDTIFRLHESGDVTVYMLFRGTLTTGAPDSVSVDTVIASSNGGFGGSEITLDSGKTYVISGAVSAAHVPIDITSLTSESSIASSDEVPVYDVSAGTVRKTTVSDLAITGVGATTQVFTSSGTWNRPTDCVAVLIEVIGGGGGGGGATGGANASAGGGGGGGGYARKVLDVTGISSATITVGSGGGGATAGNNSGSDGGNASWSDGTNTITANGGSGGNGSGNGVDIVTAGGQAASGTGGDFNARGSDGGTGLVVDGALRWSGSGGGSYMAGERKGLIGNASSGTGNAGYAHGGGGTAGGSATGATSDRGGGAGGSPLVVVTEFY